jgi:dTMP kinase
MENRDFVIHPGRGFLIVHEGISGSGKSEGITRLKQAFDTCGVPVEVVEWNANPAIRRLTSRLDRFGWLTPRLYSMLQWISFWIDYRTSIAPVLKCGGVVIADRYAYTGLTRDTANGAGAWWGRRWLALARKPDLVFFHDTSPLTCYRRIQLRGKALFFPGRQTRGSRLGPDWEMNYLTRMRNEYVRHFSSAAVCRDTNIIWVKDEMSDACETVNAYWFAKTGSDAPLAYRPDPVREECEASWT